jgi:hypothetical protein
VIRNNLPHPIMPAVFQERTVPSDARLAGWAALVETFQIQAPVRRLNEKLTDNEVASIEAKVQDSFEGFED